jgi:hypothetical protein
VLNTKEMHMILEVVASPGRAMTSEPEIAEDS